MDILVMRVACVVPTFWPAVASCTCLITSMEPLVIFVATPRACTYNHTMFRVVCNNMYM